MTKCIEGLINDHVVALTPYQSARKIGGQGTLWLNANECPATPFGVAPPNTLIAEVFGAINRYPEPQPKSLLCAYAEYAGVQPDRVMATRGADEAIELVIRTLCGDNQGVLYCPPTYGMYKVSSDCLNIATKTVPLTDEFQLDLEGIAAHLDEVKVVFVCSPNNPTGNVLNPEDIVTLLTMTQGRAAVVVDEAYIDFCMSATLVRYLNRFRHLIILRTLSKAFGLAGIRCGFVLANPVMIEALAKIIAPYPIPTPTAVIAHHALSAKGIDAMQKQVAIVRQNKADLVARLAVLPMVVRVFDSQANYVLVQFDDAQAIFEALWSQGIILRNQSHAMKLSQCIRISIGTQQDNDALIEALYKLGWGE